MKWSTVYRSAVNPDGSLFFKERLTQEFLDDARRTMGSYLFANQYLNEVLPEGSQPLKKEWLRYYKVLPEIKHSFAFIDPAISLSKDADFTGVVIIDVDLEHNWYLKYAQRYKITPSEIIDLIFRLHTQFGLNCIGIEDVAYQKALLYMMDEEMKRRKIIVPIKGIHPGTDRSKETRIMSLVPRFEWSRIFIAQGLHDFEMEYGQFPRGAHDDLLDALSQLEQIVFYPQKVRKIDEQPHPSDPKYESWYIANLHKKRDAEQNGPDYE
jgi:predicted phage terminase large subunit-like protein